MKYYHRYILPSLALSFLTGCATQQNVSLPDNFWQQKQKVAVVETKAPPAKLSTKGGVGLVDYGVIVMMNKQMNDTLSNTDLSWYTQMPVNLASQLKQHNVFATPYQRQIEDSDTNYATFASETNADKVLILKLSRIGAVRNYYSAIPLSPPQAICNMTGELIDVKTQKVLWRYVANVTEPIQGNWDQPPYYPNLKKAMQVAVSTAKQELMDSLFTS